MTRSWDFDCDPTLNVEVDNLDGTYSIAPHAGFDPTMRVAAGATVYKYEGQGVFHYDPVPATSYDYYQDNVADQTTALLMQGRVTDACGRIWVAEAVDAGYLANRVISYDAETQAILEEEGATLAEVQAEVGASPPDFSGAELGVQQTWEPESWSSKACSNDTRTWDADDRVEVAITGARSQLLRQQMPFVSVMESWQGMSPPGFFMCGGTVIKEVPPTDAGCGTYVLTAAHCVDDTFPARIRVCAVANNNNYNWPVGSPPQDAVIDCYEPITTWIHPNYGAWAGSWDPGDDIAVLRLPPLTIEDMPSQYPMRLSKKNDGWTENHSLQNLGAPGVLPACAPDLAPSISGETINYVGPPPSTGTWPGRTMLQHQAGTVSTPTDKIRTNHDGGGGHSGGPLFHCAGADGVCGALETGIIDGVWAGYNTVINRRVSSHVTDKRDWIIEKLP
ncbi:MAG: hypothetical protein KTR31_33730 [Myxococcales bacterium]|nr:hypothetical protein [Myxococcales bacterium]